MQKRPKPRHTTNSNHRYHKYKNLIRGFVPTGANQLWVSDITYIDLVDGCCYLHLVTDALCRPYGARNAAAHVAKSTFSVQSQPKKIKSKQYPYEVYFLGKRVNHISEGRHPFSGERVNLFRTDKQMLK